MFSQKYLLFTVLTLAVCVAQEGGDKRRPRDPSLTFPPRYHRRGSDKPEGFTHVPHEIPSFPPGQDPPHKKGGGRPDMGPRDSPNTFPPGDYRRGSDNPEGYTHVPHERPTFAPGQAPPHKKEGGRPDMRTRDPSITFPPKDSRRGSDKPKGFTHVPHERPSFPPGQAPPHKKEGGRPDMRTRDPSITFPPRDNRRGSDKPKGFTHLPHERPSFPPGQAPPHKKEGGRPDMRTRDPSITFPPRDRRRGSDKPEGFTHVPRNKPTLAPGQSPPPPPRRDGRPRGNPPN